MITKIFEIGKQDDRNIFDNTILHRNGHSLTNEEVTDENSSVKQINNNPKINAFRTYIRHDFTHYLITNINIIMMIF